MTIFSTENFRGRLFFISNNLDDLFVPIIARSWEKNVKNSNLKIVGELIEKNSGILDEWKGIPKIFSFSCGIEISILLLQTDILQKTVIRCS